MPSLLPARLTKARERLSLTQAQVAERTGIGPSSLSEFERGHREPSLGQLQALARLYQRSLPWMLGEEAEPVEVVLWRQRPEPPVAAEVGARFLRLSEQYRNLELWCSDTVECDLPRVEADAGKFHSFDSANLAKRVRNELALGDRPGESLLRTLEEVCGVKVFHLTFEPTGTAACVKSAAFGASILLNKSNVPWRRAFDTAHELFHLLTWESFNKQWTGDPPIATAQEEKLANVFASNLLMPEEPFRLAVQRRMTDVHTPGMDQAFAVAREFGVSVDAVLVRMSFLFGLKQEVVERARAAWRALAALYEDREVDNPPELPRRFQAMAMAALKGGNISIGRFSEYLGLSRQRAMEIARSQEECGEGTAPTPP